MNSRFLFNTLVLWALNVKYHFLIFPQGQATLLTKLLITSVQFWLDF